jgi:hypothetical protein
VRKRRGKRREETERGARRVERKGVQENKQARQREREIKRQRETET